MRLSKNNVFNRYTPTVEDHLAKITYEIYRKYYRLRSHFKPQTEMGKHRFSPPKFRNRPSTPMPCGFNLVKSKAEDAYLNLEYIDFFDYLPKENIEIFQRDLQKYAKRNGFSLWGALRNSDLNLIANMGSYFDASAFSNLATLRVTDKLAKEYFSEFSISLHNLSSTFLLVKYHFICTDNVNNEINSICKTEYECRSDIIRFFPAPWYKPESFGHSIVDGDRVRCETFYAFLSELKWEMFKIINSGFKVYFISDKIFPPVFETYSTNIRPSNSNENRNFWRSVMFSESQIDYAPKYNICVDWGYRRSERESIRLAAYCGGKYAEDDYFLEMIPHEISDVYAVYMAADALLNVARCKIEKCNQLISKTIKKSNTSKILKTRVVIEKELYYCYRFVTEFTGDTIDCDDMDDFHCKIEGMRSFTYMGFNSIATQSKDVKEIIDRVTKLMNDAADYRNSRSNIRLQWLMMIITLISVLLAFMSYSKLSSSEIGTALISVMEFVKTFIRQCFI